MMRKILGLKISVIKKEPSEIDNPFSAENSKYQKFFEFDDYDHSKNLWRYVRIRISKDGKILKQYLDSEFRHVLKEYIFDAGSFENAKIHIEIETEALLKTCTYKFDPEWNEKPSKT